MNPFENINIPDNKDETSIECGSDLVTNINAYFEDNGRYLNQEDSQWILDRLGTDIDICYSQTRESFANLNTGMFENGINLVAGGIGEDKFLPELGIDKTNLQNSVPNFPQEYTFRISGDWIVFSDIKGKPIVNYNKIDSTYSDPGMMTFSDSMNDNVNGGGYVLAEEILQKGEFDEANNAIDGVLREGSIQIDELENPKAQENISRLYGIQLADFQKALQYFIQKSNILLFQKNPNMRMLSSGDFQISAILENGEHHIVNFHPNGEVKSEHTF